MPTAADSRSLVRRPPSRRDRYRRRSARGRAMPAGCQAARTRGCRERALRERAGWLSWRDPSNPETRTGTGEASNPDQRFTSARAHVLPPSSVLRCAARGARAATEPPRRRKHRRHGPRVRGEHDRGNASTRGARIEPNRIRRQRVEHGPTDSWEKEGRTVSGGRTPTLYADRSTPPAPREPQSVDARRQPAIPALPPGTCAPQIAARPCLHSITTARRYSPMEASRPGHCPDSITPRRGCPSLNTSGGGPGRASHPRLRPCCCDRN